MTELGRTAKDLDLVTYHVWPRTMVGKLANTHHEHDHREQDFVVEGTASFCKQI